MEIISQLSSTKMLIRKFLIKANRTIEYGMETVIYYKMIGCQSPW